MTLASAFAMDDEFDPDDMDMDEDEEDDDDEDDGPDMGDEDEE